MTRRPPNGTGVALPGTPEIERVRQGINRRLEHLEQQPGATAILKKDIELPDGAEISIPHNIGRPVSVFWSAVRGATTTGRIGEIRDGALDRKQYAVIRADGWGSTITVDVWLVA